MSKKSFDLIVVGAGHAGCEAALVGARLGASGGLVTLRLDKIAQMSCTPAIGGVGKGHLAKEIDEKYLSKKKYRKVSGRDYFSNYLSEGWF